MESGKAEAFTYCIGPDAVSLQVSGLRGDRHRHDQHDCQRVNAVGVSQLVEGGSGLKEAICWQARTASTTRQVQPINASRFAQRLRERLTLYILCRQMSLQA